MSEDPFTTGETVTRTFRFDQIYETFLIEEAKKRGTSVNSLVEQIFRKYMLIYRFFGVPGTVAISHNHLDLGIEALSKEDIAKLFPEGSISSFISILSRIGAPLDQRSLPVLIELGGIIGWFNAEIIRRGDSEVYYLRHGLGENWGFYLKTFFEAYFKEILEMEQKVEQYNGFILFTVDPKKLTKNTRR